MNRLAPRPYKYGTQWQEMEPCVKFPQKALDLFHNLEIVTIPRLLVYRSDFSFFRQGCPMSRIEKKLNLSDDKFKRRIGTSKPVFQTMLDILQTAHNTLHKLGGKPNDLSVGDKLLITLKYYREYTTMESIADDYDCSKSSVCRSIHWVEHVLSADGRFQLPGKKALQEEEPKTVVIDVMEHAIERPQKNRKTTIPARKSDTRSNRRLLRTLKLV
jgi:predicted DNA-binding protein YlxM (UPF0122 family)